MENNELPYHEQRRLRKEGILPKLSFKKPPKPLRKLSIKAEKERKERKEAGGDSVLDVYFDYHMKHSYPKCDNCGMEAGWLLEPQEDKKKQEWYTFIWRSCQAHVLAKKDSIGGFHSIATNLTNHLVLFPHFGGLCNCHGRYDSSYEEMAKMAVFPKAIDIINQLYHFIAADERKYLPEIILQEIKPTIFNQ